MRITIGTGTIVVSGLCAAVLAFAPAASAATGYRVSHGGPIKAASRNTLSFVIPGNSMATVSGCTFHASGRANKGRHHFLPKTYTTAKGLSAAGRLTKQSLTGCSNTLAGSVTITPKGTWRFGLSTRTATGGKGYLYGIDAPSSVLAGACTFTVAGATYGTYNTKKGTFTGSTRTGLVLKDVAPGCSVAGVKDGDRAYLEGTVVLKPRIAVTG